MVLIKLTNYAFATERKRCLRHTERERDHHSLLVGLNHLGGMSRQSDSDPPRDEAWGWLH